MTNSVLERAGLYARTISHLRPEQLVHRIRLRTKKVAVSRWPALLEARWTLAIPPAPVWPAPFVPLDVEAPPYVGAPSDSVSGNFTFLNDRRELGSPVDWNAPGATRLWRYHLHYWEWAWPFTSHPDRTWAGREAASLWLSWQRASAFGRWDTYAPYPTSMRVWVLCCLYRDLFEPTAVADELLRSLAAQAGLIRHNLEVDVGGNHLIKNLKALVAAAILLADHRLLDEATTRIAHELGRQVLPDGGHYERSPSYHCQVLGDLIDVQRLLTAAGEEPPAGLDAAIQSMRTWLGTLVAPTDDVPLFNDCTSVGSRRLQALQPIVTEARPLLESGYANLAVGDRVGMVVDFGAPCPPDLPAHAHADLLSFELQIDGDRFIVDTGTSTYEPSHRRAYERSTAAHNTVVIDDINQIEVWGAFRVGRLAIPQLESFTYDRGAAEVTASHRGYAWLRGSPVHHRSWILSPDHLQITDEISGGGHHTVACNLHIPAQPYEQIDPSTFRFGTKQIRFCPHAGSAMVWRAQMTETGIATDFGRTKPGLRLEYRGDVTLPVRLETTIEW